MSGKTFHCLSKVGEQGVIGGIFTGGVHLKLSALGGLCSLEVHLDVIVRSIVCDSNATTLFPHPIQLVLLEKTPRVRLE